MTQEDRRRVPRGLRTDGRGDDPGQRVLRNTIAEVAAEILKGKVEILVAHRWDKFQRDELPKLLEGAVEKALTQARHVQRG
jgi:hypothetical protein